MNKHDKIRLISGVIAITLFVISGVVFVAFFA